MPGSAAAAVVAMDTSAVSSSAMVTVAAFAAPSMAMSASPDVIAVSVTMTVSSPSTTRSFSTLTSMVADVVPARMVTVPESAV